MFSRRTFFYLFICTGIIQTALYYVGGSTVRSDGGFALIQPDTQLYCQAARRIVEGFPFSFACESLPSTGTTSVLYPFILAIPYALGLDGDAIFLAGFLLNAIFYLLFLVGWSIIIYVKISGLIPRVTAAILLLLSGQIACTAFASTDTGLWMAISAWIAVGLATKRKWIYIPLLLIAPWARPEGLMLSAALAAFSFLALIFFHKKDSVWSLIGGLFGTISGFCVFVLNYLISGRFGFASVASKGYLMQMPFPDAVFKTLLDFAKLCKVYFLSLPDTALQSLFILPVIGGICVCCGLITRRWNNARWWNDLAWYAAGALGMLSVAYSGSAGENTDRYLSWFLPTIFMLFGYGLQRFCQCFRDLKTQWLIIAGIGSYALVSSVVFVMYFHVNARQADVLRQFAADCEKIIPQKASVGLLTGCGNAYQFSDRPVKHLFGIYSPEFFTSRLAYMFEILKNESKTRFDYWFINPSVMESAIFTSGKPDFNAFGEVVFPGPKGYELRKSDWSVFDNAVSNPEPKYGSLNLVARVDVGYEPHEKAFAFEPYTEYDQPILEPFIQLDFLSNGDKIIEAGRLLLGGAEMSVNLQPGRDVEVVLRTLSRVNAVAHGAFGVSAGGEYAFNSPMGLFVYVDETPVGKVSFDINEHGFSDVHFIIPGSVLKNKTSRIAFHGSHVSCGYWFFQ